MGLRKAFPYLTPSQTSALAVIQECRRRAANRGFPNADSLFSDEDGLSMATSPGIVAIHAELLKSTGRPVLDIAAGCGIEAQQLATAGLTLVCYEINPVRAHFAIENTQAINAVRPGAVTVICDDSSAANASTFVVYWDPSRRAGGARNNQSISYLEPNPALWKTHITVSGCGLGKLPTGIPNHDLATLGDCYAFLGENRDCKEAIVTVGIQTKWPTGSVYILEGDHTFTPHGEPADPTCPIEDIKVIIDPHAAVVRGGCLEVLAQQLNGSLLSPSDDYICGEHLPMDSDGNLATMWTVLNIMPANPKKVAATLEELQAKLHIIKKRRAGKDVDTFLATLIKHTKKNTDSQPICGIFFLQPDGLWVALCSPKAIHEEPVEY